MIRPAIFLDRDGVINRNRSGHIKSWAEFEFIPGAIEALQRLAQLGWPIVVVSNQGAIGRGLVSQQTVDEIHTKMVSIVQSEGGRIDEVLYCPHRPEDNCACRKPRPGLLLRAADQLGLDLSHSFLIGDAETDIFTAQLVSCFPVLVKTGRGLGHMAWLRQGNMIGYYLAEDLADAVNWILGPGWLTKFYPISSRMPIIGLNMLQNTLTDAAPYALGNS